jgi:hypothetical protein
MTKTTGVILRFFAQARIHGLILLCAGLSMQAPAADPPIQSGDVRIHYFRPDNSFGRPCTMVRYSRTRWSGWMA